MKCPIHRNSNLKIEAGSSTPNRQDVEMHCPEGCHWFVQLSPQDIMPGNRKRCPEFRFDERADYENKMTRKGALMDAPNYSEIIINGVDN